MFAPGSAAFSTPTTSRDFANEPKARPSGSSVSSNGTTASAPAGIGAPVMIRTAVPGSTCPSNTYPAASSPTTRSIAGASSVAPDVSAARTA